MSKVSRHTFLFVAVFSFGYMVNDVVEEIGVDIIHHAQADVAGMSYRELRRDRDFKKAVKYIVQNCSVSGYVDGGYLYSSNISC